MSRLALLALAALTLARCSRKEEVVVAAPVAPASGAQAAAPQAGRPRPLPPGAGNELPPGHPSLDPMQGGAAPGAGQAPAAVPQPPPHGAAMSGGADVGDVKVPKATGPDARTIAEVFAQRAALKDKTVTIRGKVVKYNPGIMGRNWIHLRDGTGTAGKDNDVTVTSQDGAKLGEVVVVQGKVAVDQDIGMGAPYPVVVQDAKVTR
ncbi:MAG TPA: hypothetical protein VMU15_21860 [Anaeromyxobacter sp.]|nr:hypothetical protein [Anaeromyxobacter sp.]